MINKSVQVNIPNQFRSKATLTDNKGVHQSTSPLNKSHKYNSVDIIKGIGKNYEIEQATKYDDNDVYIDMTSLTLIGV